jgi:hypothetical protein
VSFAAHEVEWTDRTVAELIRQGLGAAPRIRTQAIRVLGSLAPIIDRCGGDDSWHQITHALMDVYAWWP